VTALDLADGYEAVRTGVGALWLPCDVVSARGPDAVSFLQGQLSQDVERLAVGEAAWSLVLQPQGKVDALVRVARVADDELVLAVDGGWGEALLARLTRFKLRVKADLEPLDWRCLGLRGPGAADAAAGAAGDVVQVDASWPGLPGVDLLGPAADLDVPAGVPLVGDDVWTAVRIEAGVPVLGAELDERTIPAEAGVVERTVSFTKGCYTGQELVARIDSRGGNVPRHLAGVVLDDGADGDLPPAGAVVVVGDRDAGAVTSAGRSPRLGVVALAYVRRDVPAETPAVVRWEVDGATVEQPARVAPLPLVP
jgi:tRNA-modifying protein YgfZ